MELHLKHQIEFDKLTEVIGRQDAESVHASNHVLNQDKELTNKLVEL